MPKGISAIARICLHCQTAFTATNGAMVYCSEDCKFWSKVNPIANENGCLLWTAGVYKDGYGVFWGDRAHRVAWRLTFGHLDSRLQVLHACDTPLCCNTNHLMAGTNIANLIDRDRKLRHGYGERNGRAKLTESDVRAIREAKAVGVPAPILAAKYGLNRSQINRANRGASWSRVQ